MIDSHIIPRGTQIGVNIYTLHHNEEFFPDPFAFKPERWLFSENTPKATRQQVHDAFAAFSLGARGCGGKAMAYLESSLVVAKTLWYFDFESALGVLGKVEAAPITANNGANEFQMFNGFTSAHDGFNLIFRPRECAFREFSGCTDAPS